MAKPNFVGPCSYLLVLFLFTVSTFAQGGAERPGTPKKTTAPNKTPPATKKPPTTVSKSKPVPPAPDFNLVNIPAGSFMMGSDNGRGNEKPVRRVTINYSFYMGKYEVTQAQWKAVMGNNPSHFKGDNLPVETVTWNEAKEFIRKLNNLQKEYEYRLPSESEWEYAARAGTTGDNYGNLDSIAWYKENSGGKTHPVGQTTANNFGLHDMSGNVWEWVEDLYNGSYDGLSADGSINQSVGDVSFRVVRGGSWNHESFELRTAYRFRCAPADRFYSNGVRLVARANK